MEVKDLFVVIGVIIGICFLVIVTIYTLTNIGENSLVTGDSSSQSNFTYTSPVTLTAEEGITSSSLQTLNQTWLEFDGVNDVVTFDIESSKAVFSFWFKNATTEWTNVINNYDDVYVNNVSTPTWDYFPYYVSGDNVYVGKFDASTFFNGSIDNFQIYESKLIVSEVSTIYEEGH